MLSPPTSRCSLKQLSVTKEKINTLFREYSGRAAIPNIMLLFKRSAASTVLGILLFGAPLAARAETEIPLDVKESSLGFVGESFLHNFHGEAKQFSGMALLDPTATPSLQHATINIKTASLTTFNTERDQKMDSWLKIDSNPEASFNLTSVKPIKGTATKADADQPATYLVSGLFHLNESGQNQSGEPLSGEAQAWTANGKLIVNGKIDVDTLKHGLVQIKEGLLTVGTKVHVQYHLVFDLPAGGIKQ